MTLMLAHESALDHTVFCVVCVAALLLGVFQLFRVFDGRRKRSGQQLEMDREVAERTREIRNTNRELEKRQAFSRMLSEISTRFITLPPSRIDAEIPVALGRVARAINADRANIYNPPPDGKFGDDDFYVDISHEWNDSDVGAVDPAVRRIYPAMFPWAKSLYEKGDPVVVLDPSQIPESAKPERELFKKMGWISMTIIPLFVEKRFVGNLNFTTLDKPLAWLPILVSELRVVGEIFANALERKRQNEMMMALRQDAHDAEERERTRISRELHDQLGGSLSALRIQAKGLQKKLAPLRTDLAESAHRITEIIDDTLPDVRRICTELRPAVLDDLELAEALE